MPHPSKLQALRAYLVFLVFVVSLALCASVLTFDPADWPSPKVWPHPDPAYNACGKVGAFFAYHLFYWIGEGVYPLILFATLAAVHLLVHGFIRSPWQRLFGVMVLVTGTAVAVRLVSPGDADSLPGGNGGILGTAVAISLMENFKPLGTWVILLYGMMVGLLFAAEGWVLRLPTLAKKMGEAASVGAITIAKNVAVPRPTPLPTVGAAATLLLGKRVREDTEETGGRVEPKINPNRPKAASPEPAQKAKLKKAAAPDARTLFDDHDDGADVGKDRQGGKAAVKDVDDEIEPAEGKSGLVVKLAPEPALPKEEEVVPQKAYPTELADWEYPPLTLLEDMEYAYSAQQEAVVREKAKILERTLQEFRYEAQVVEIDTGPVITMYELRLAAGIKVSHIAALSNDVARALRAPAVRVVAPIPGKNTIGIEVPNLDKERVRLKELMALSGAKAKKMALPIFIGKDASGNTLVADLATMPHLLIAGTTGSGKSVCINSIIASILMTRRPDMVKMILVDPKMVELSQFATVPHLMCPIVTDMARAETILEWAVTKMDERYELLAEAGVRNVSAYNRLTKEEIYERFQPGSEAEEAQIPLHIAYNVVIIDELADLMMTSAKEVEHHLSRLAQKSRAVGIHIVVATQRPEAKVVTGLIKSNLPCRIAFRVASRMDSRIVLDQNGAEVLMGQGDMLYLPPGSSKLIRAQGTFVEDSELKRLIEFMGERSRPEFHPELVQMRGKGAGEPGERDELFDQAVEIILQSKRGSVSLLQRRLMVGYSRASRLIDQMAEAGIVGEYKGSQAREVSMTLEEWAVVKAQMDADQKAGYAADEEDELEATAADSDEEREEEEEEEEEEEDVEGEYEDGEEDEEDEDEGEEEEEEEEEVS